MNGDQKITAEHLSRRAIVYLRQSSEGQVRNNLESQKLQYAMVHRARGLGFSEVEVIDVDLGASAAVAAKRREGFERLLGAVALREVGLILSRELSRLLRTDKDFCQLIELCQMFDTLVGDDQTIYDVSRMDDQLVLGIKATMSVVEFKVLRMRLAEGKENKAKRGEIYPRLPPGYVRDAAGQVSKDPNLRVQEAIELIFAKFRETWSIRQTFKWFRDNEIELPVGQARGGKNVVVFQQPRHTFIACVLHNPFYAGAYAWGRRPMQVVWREGRLRKRQGKAVPPKEARVFLRDHHAGYIDWATFEENQRMIRRNDFRGVSDETAGAARAGKGLLAGLLRCGRCGRKLHVRYWGASGTNARYLCVGDYGADGAHYCVGFGGATVDHRFGEEIVRVLSPLGVRASLEALEHRSAEQGERHRAIQRQVQQLEYDSARAFEQYNEVDARNRLVASELERRWNDKLDELERTRAQLTELDEQRKPVTAEERNALAAFGEHFEDVWNHPRCPIELKKQIARTVIEEILVDEKPPGTLSFIVHWKGGCHTAFEMVKVSSKTVHKTAEENLEVIRKMAHRYDDNVIANVLNKLGRRTGKGKPWSQVAVKTARRNHGIEGHARTVEDPDVLTLQGAVSYTETSDTTIRKLVDGGVLPMRQLVPFAPWEIQRSDLDSDRVRVVLARLKQTGRVVLGDTSETQGDLFE
ncbi:MAG: recombinase family protein [Polyangiaceae bacterium]|nr:recombinase family protein [Polyangiaceae bacterium]MCL4755480.1 recombinase family protein [Myxococcales bacterium]